jgi:hypothetical protein
LVSGAQPLPDDDSCPDGAEFWYGRTPYRKIPKSSCEGGERPDRGAEHRCPGFGAHSAGFWWTMFFIPFGFTALVAFWYYRRSGYQRGYANHLCIFPPDIDSLLAISVYPIGMPSLIPVRYQLSSRFRGTSWALLVLRGAMLSGFLSYLNLSSDQGVDTVMYQLTKMRKSCDSMTRIRRPCIQPGGYHFVLRIHGTMLPVQRRSCPLSYSSCDSFAEDYLTGIVGRLDL